jgi:hypothetical protein
VLLTSYGAVTLDLDVPDRPHPLDPVDLLTDLARRILARIVPDRSSPGSGDSREQLAGAELVLGRFDPPGGRHG